MCPAQGHSAVTLVGPNQHPCPGLPRIRNNFLLIYMYTYANVQMWNNFQSRNWIISYPLVYLNTGILDAQKNSPIEMVILSSNSQHMFWLRIFIIPYVLWLFIFHL